MQHGVTMIIAMAAGVACADEFNDLGDYLAATTDNQLIDFDTLPGGGDAPETGDILDDYLAFGVSFPPGNFYSGLAGAVSGTHGWINDTLNGDGTERLFDVDIVADDVTAVGVWQTLFAGGGTTTLEAYDALGNLLATAEGDADVDSLDFFGLTTDVPVKKVIVRWTDWFGWALDDLYVGKAGDAGCAADCNDDGVLNILDFVCFQGLFTNGDDAADCNNDGVLNILDFVCFQQVFQAGCD